MKGNSKTLLPLLALTFMIGATAAEKKICIGHGGAGTYAPFNTMSSFKLSLEMKVDYIETDLQLSKDGVLVCIHDPVLERRTNVEEVFPDRFTIIEREGKSVKTWYVNDFTLSDLRKLDMGSSFSEKFKGERIATFQELIEFARGNIGLYPETKDADFYATRGIDIDEALHDVLVKNDLHTKKGQEKTPLIIQSFSESSLRRLRDLGGDAYTLIRLVWFGQWDDTMSDAGLKKVAEYANGVGPFLSMVMPPNTDRVYAAHQLGLQVHVWKLYEAYPPKGFKDATGFEEYLLNTVGIDGIFTESPDTFPR